ncbi:protein phosphatase 2C [Halovivax asiaticus JCM 14624]|uniref:Protein phosphatase 2C n=1 Tax=Halovivax asiaticus JCM 14624 TaxID=1227490 RepID=M0BA39_9EURY|nr:PP2C family serine/threonine-protein phosphatase [Halovivax asiaticus]ELZ07771.1 protein phosphatase 2C [Halovivax asiaticus JCM 14624]
MEHASTVDIGRRKREANGINEDSVATTVFENHHRGTSRSVGLFVLGDGVGGEASGDVASFLTTSVVRAHLTEALLGDGTDRPERYAIDAYDETPPTVSETDDGTSPLSESWIRTAIQEAIDEAHAHVQQYARDVGARPATTVVAAVYADGRLHYGWVGDSRLYVCNRDHETIEQLTRDHAVTNDLLERGEIDHDEHARVHEDATAITNAVGGSGHGKPSVDVEFGSVPVYRDDVILLTSDGLIDAFPDIAPLRAAYEAATDTEAVRADIRDTLVTDDEIRDIVLGADDLSDAVEELIDFANDRGGKDNLSISLASDPAAAETPDRPPARGIESDSPGLVDQETEIESPPQSTSAEDGSAGDVDSTAATSPETSADPEASSGTPESSAPSTADDDPLVPDEHVVTLCDGEPPTAAIAVVGEDRVFEVGDGVTIGCVTDTADDGPDIGLDVGPDGIVEPAHTTIGYDEDADAWTVRDSSSSGTYVEAAPGEWVLLLSAEGVELHREHGFDPGAAAEEAISATTTIEDGTAFTLQDPRSTETVTFQFFRSVADARDRRNRPDETGESAFEQFIV